MSGIFDPAIFDPAIFDEGGVVVPFQGAGSGGRRGKKKGKAGKKARRGLFSDEPVEEQAVAEMAPTNDVDEDEEDAIMLLLLAA